MAVAGWLDGYMSGYMAGWVWQAGGVGGRVAGQLTVWLAGCMTAWLQAAGCWAFPGSTWTWDLQNTKEEILKNRTKSRSSFYS